MPPRGVKSSKRARQYEHIKDSAKKQGRSTARAKEIAAATVNKQRREAGETKSSGGSRNSSSKKSGAKKSAAKKSSSKKSRTRARKTSGSGTRKSGAKKR